MPVQTQTRSQAVPPDPFGDPNPIRLVSPHSQKLSSKRDVPIDNNRDAATTRGQDPRRAKPIRSQTQQSVGNGRSQPPRRSLSQDSAPAPPVPEKSKSSKRSGKKGSAYADVIDHLDYSGCGPTFFHHDGPFDACAPSRNRHRIKAPMAAWSEQTKQAIEEDFKASKEAPRYEPPTKQVDAIARAWGIHEPEPFEDFSAGGGQSSDYRPNYPTQRRSEEGPPRRREPTPRRAALPPPQPIFVPGADVEFAPSGASPPLSPGGGAGMKRSKSLMQRIRRMRESPNIPVNGGDGNGAQNTYESGGSGRPNHKSQNSFAGRLAGGGIREQLPSPQEEDAYVLDEASKNKGLPRLPNTSSTNPGEAGYFEQQTDFERPAASGVGRKLSLIQRVGDVVRGRK